MSLYRIAAPGTPGDPGDLVEPTMIAAFDGWVDAGNAATAALETLVDDAPIVVSFDGDQLFDYRSRRPTLEIKDGSLADLTWPELSVRRATVDDRDMLILTGPEPDDRWQTFRAAVAELGQRLGVVEWISLGAIPAAVPHTRPVPVLGTTSESGRLRGGVHPGPAGVLRVPAATVSVLELTMAEHGIPAVGYFAQVPHYVSGPYPAASVELLTILGRHLGVELSSETLAEEARQLRTRLDAATALEETTRAYVERLEAMVDEQRLPSGEELISEIERFLREGGTEGSQRPGTGS
ncbi:MAG: PAC2 family protein [Chloroflexi bacterium]|nr:PAC2 family protein [Chloroflexota bacterium]